MCLQDVVLCNLINAWCYAVMYIHYRKRWKGRTSFQLLYWLVQSFKKLGAPWEMMQSHLELFALADQAEAPPAKSLWLLQELGPRGGMRAFAGTAPVALIEVTGGVTRVTSRWPIAQLQSRVRQSRSKPRCPLGPRICEALWQFPCS